jgi:hypothetical protein
LNLLNDILIFALSIGYIEIKQINKQIKMSISNRSVDIAELKNQAIAYYSMNADILKKVESGLNDLFYESPHDVFGFLVIIVST